MNHTQLGEKIFPKGACIRFRDERYDGHRNERNSKMARHKMNRTDYTGFALMAFPMILIGALILIHAIWPWIV